MHVRTLLALCLLGAAPLMAPVTAFAEGKSVKEATEKDRAAATKAYLDAKSKYEASKLDEALTGFRASYDIVASPNSHIMVANVLGDMKRNAEAYAEAEIVAEEADALGGDYTTTGKKARELMDQLRPSLGFVSVSREAGVSGKLRVAGRDIPEARARKPIPVEPGSVEVVVDAASGPLRERVDVGAGKTASVSIAPKTAPQPDPVPSTPSGSSDTQSILRIAGFAAAGLGVVGMISFAGLGAASNGKFHDLEDKCPNSNCPADLEGDISSGKSLQAGANAMAAIGVIGLAAGAGLITASFLMSDGSGAAPKKKEDSVDDAAHRQVRVDVALGLGSVGVSGSF